jgi:hypothetical protein
MQDELRATERDAMYEFIHQPVCYPTPGSGREVGAHAT